MCGLKQGVTCIDK